KNFFHGAQKQQNIGFLRAIAHQAKAPDFSAERSNTTRDFDIEFFKQLAAEFRVVDACGNHDGRDGDEAVVRIFHEHFQAHRFAASDERLLAGPVAFPTRFEAVLNGDTHGFAQRIDQRDGRSVVIETTLAPVGHGGGDVEIPALHFGFARGHDFFGARPDGDGRHAWWRAECFLRAAEHDVKPLLVYAHGNGRERGDGVHDEKRAEFVGNFAEVVEIGDDASGSFAVGEANNFDFLAGSGTANVFGFDVTAKLRFDVGDFGLSARGDFIHAIGKVTVDANDGFVAGLKHVDDGGFNAAGAGSGHGHGDAVLRLENLAHEFLRFVHAGFE